MNQVPDLLVAGAAVETDADPFLLVHMVCGKGRLSVRGGSSVSFVPSQIDNLYNFIAVDTELAARDF